MPGLRAPWALLLLCLALTGACRGEGETPRRAGEPAPDEAAREDGPITVVDAAGRRISLARPARRVVSLVPSATLTLEALDARRVLVGRTDFDTVSWAAHVPSVGGGLEPNLEAVVALEPELVVRFGGEQDPDTPARLDELGIAHAAIRPDNVAGILSSIRLVGTLVGRRAAADSLAGAIGARLDSLHAAHAGADRPRVAYVLGGTPPWVAGPGTYIHELVELVGGENVFADLGSLYASVSPEEFVAREIDVVLVHGAGDFRGLAAGEIPVREVSDVLELPGPGVARAAAEVARLIHGAGPS